MNLDELERLHRKATPGEWHWDSDPLKGDSLNRSRARIVTIGKTITQAYYVDDSGQHDAAYIAALHNAFPALLALARDGERYRWLRSKSDVTYREMGLHVGEYRVCFAEIPKHSFAVPSAICKPGNGVTTDQKIDAAIDAAMKERT